jgi:AbrB family looped-hinge helix DNA binding protein
MRLTSKGQVTIPQDIRAELGLMAGTEVEFAIDGDSVRVRKSTQGGRGRAVVEHMRGRGNRRFTTEQLMRMMRG